ncbi:heterokaryon incompatibility protein-domain-containing protein, partial [Leptodontidium sp. 2 PMI_412]
MGLIGTLEGRYLIEEWLLRLIPDVEKYQLELGAWTGSKSSLDIAKGWMKKCDTNHQDCHSYKQQVKSDKSPSRLLSLGSVTSPHLQLCDENLGHVEYATLSHCWGTNMILKLVTSNIDAMKKAIDPEDLSPTFRDAVAVCRHLGLRYLWIDSLCIIQDSAQDWQYESSRMHSVYSNAILNVCGTAANPQGLFVERKNEHVHTGPILVDWEGVCQGVYFCMPEGVWIDEVHHSPLNERGWVLQERLLSQRNLHFGENQLFWECQQHTACELTPDGFEGEMRPEPYTQKVLNDTLSSYAIWDMIVNKYSNSKLTFGEDRLIAVSALARHCQTHLGLEGEYLAGIWSRYIPYQLLWETDVNVHGERQRGYQAPTWSWASMD